MNRSRPSAEPMSATDLAAWVEASATRSQGLLFTATAREDLDEIASWQRLSDLAFAGQCRAIVAAHNRASSNERQFVPDEVALAINASPTTGTSLTILALQAAALPGLLESVESGALTERHVRAVLRELDTVDLDVEQRAAVVMVLLARFDAHTPGELVKLVRRLVLTVDLPAARRRAEKATRSRGVWCRPDTDGQGVLSARGPLAAIAAVRACLDTMLQDAPDPGDERNNDARMFDLFIDLLTGGSDGPGRFEIQVLVPVGTAKGDTLEPAEIPGFGPLLPGTARELMDLADAFRRIAVDSMTGEVVAVDDAVPTGRRYEKATSYAQQKRQSAEQSSDPTAGKGSQPQDIGCNRPVPDRVAVALARMSAPPIVVRDLDGQHYRPSGRLTRHLEARDRTCQFPGCHRRAGRTDKDHRIPWPRGATTLANMACLCRRHHRAKHISFTLTRDVDGALWWTTRGGHRFRRRPDPH